MVCKHMDGHIFVKCYPRKLGQEDGHGKRGFDNEIGTCPPKEPLIQSLIPEPIDGSGFVPTVKIHSPPVEVEISGLDKSERCVLREILVTCPRPRLFPFSPFLFLLGTKSGTLFLNEELLRIRTVTKFDSAFFYHILQLFQTSLEICK